MKLSQFADDTSLICKNLTSVGNALNILADFGAISGLHLDKSKTKALWLGPWRSNLDGPLGLDWTNEPVKVLGTFVSYDSVGDERKNFAKKVDNLKTKLSAWRSRKLSLFGRCLISKTLGLSQIIRLPCLTFQIITHLQCNRYFSSSYGKTNQIKSRDKSYIRTMAMVVCGSLMSR